MDDRFRLSRLHGGAHRVGVERVGDRRLSAERPHRLGALVRAHHARDPMSVREQQWHQPPADRAGRAGEEYPHAAGVRLAAALGGGTESGTAHTMPSVNPAEPMPSARLKRPRMFSSAITLVSSTS